MESGLPNAQHPAYGRREEQNQQQSNIVFATSPDGTNFQASGTVITNGGIPELTTLDDGSIRIFYNGPGGIVSQRSIDGGMTWQPENGSRLASQAFFADPSVVRLLSNSRVLFVKGFNSTELRDPRGHHVMMPESQDGFTLALAPSVLVDSASVPDGIVLSAPTLTEQPASIPQELLLSQNFPNPFNPATTITFTVPTRSMVTLRVFDLLGREVTALVEGEFLPGTYETTWRAHAALSGMYLYRFVLGNASGQKKMLLVR